MPTYEYRCRDCGTVFEEFRGMDKADSAAPCPEGHDDTVRLLSLFATVGRAAGRSGAAPTGGCGAGCACYPN